MVAQSIKISASLLIQDSLSTKADFCEFLEDFSRTFEIYAPEYWNDVEPINRKWDIARIIEELPASERLILWKRKSKPAGWGDVAKRLIKANSEVKHACHGLFLTASSDNHIQSLINYSEHVTRKYGVAYAFIDSPSVSYREAARKNKLAPFNGDMYVRTEKLKACLHDVLWGQIFGPEYVKLFGLEKLLSAPAYRVERIADDSVYMQLTDSLFDVHDDYERVDGVRQQVKRYLDDNIFFNPDLPERHVYRTPVFKFVD